MLELPERYYLTHFEEFLDYVRGPSAGLLAEEHLNFIQTFYSLNADSQCALVRIANRKSRFIAHTSMLYDEIHDPLTQLDCLRECGLLNTLNLDYVNTFLDILTRPQLTAPARGF